jgi:chromosome segregation ATPase
VVYCTGRLVVTVSTAEVSVVPKRPRSFSIDEDLVEILGERDEMNASAAVNKFLREFVSGGRGSEAALEVRLSQLDEEIASTEKKLERLERERDRIEERLRQNRSELTEQVNDVVNLANSSPSMEPSDLTVDNPMITNRAGKAGVSAERFVEEIQAKVDDD